MDLYFKKIFWSIFTAVFKETHTKLNYRINKSLHKIYNNTTARKKLDGKV